MGPSIYLAIPIMGVLAIVQTAVLPRFPVVGVVPQLLFLVALAWGLLRGLEQGVIWAFIAGIWVDLFSVAPLGLTALIYVVAVGAAVALQGLLPPRRLLVAILLSVVATLIYMALTLVGLRLFGHGMSAGGMAQLLPIVIMHAILIAPIVLLLQAILRVFQPRPVQF